MCRYDGLDQKDVIKDLEDAVEEMSGNPATFKTKSPNLLSPFETIQHRANDLSTWSAPSLFARSSPHLLPIPDRCRLTRH